MSDYATGAALSLLDSATRNGDDWQTVQAMRDLLFALGDSAWVPDQSVRDRLLYAVVRRVIEAGSAR